jgi:autotransporter-associated beta strand protein
LGGGTYSNTITISPGATFKYNSSADQTLSQGTGVGTGGVLRGAGSFIKDGDGTLTVSEDTGPAPSGNLFTGSITINKGTLKMVGGYAFFNNESTYTIASGAVLHLAGTTDDTYPATGTTGTTINGAGTLRISDGDFWDYYKTAIVKFQLGSGGLIDVQQAVPSVPSTLWGYAFFDWTNNLARLNVDGVFDLYRGPSVFADALTGAGEVTRTYAGTGNTLTVGVANGSGTFSGTIAGTIAFTKTGSGTQTLSGVSTYTGSTTVSGGKLTIDANSINGTSGVSIGAAEFNYNSATALSKNVVFAGTGGTLSGTGTISTAVTVTSGNTLAPGSGVGTLTLGGLAIADGGIFNWENNGVNTLGTGDVANVGGTTTISSTVDTGSQLDLQFAAGTSFSNAFWNTNRSWDFITGGVTAGNLFDASNIDIFINSVQQGTTNIITREGAFTTAVSGGNLQLVWTTVLHGDTNGDNVVDAADYIALKTNFGLTGIGATLEKGNVTGAVGVDGTVDWDDLQVLMANFGKTLPAPAAPAPEPATLGLLAIGALALLRRRRRAA